MRKSKKLFVSWLKRKPWSKSWLCIQKLNKVSLIDRGSTKSTLTCMWIPLFNGIFEWHLPNFWSQVRNWFCAMSDWVNWPRTDGAVASHVIRSRQYVKSVRIRSFSGPYFPAFGLNTERHSVFLCIQSERGEIRTRKTPNTDSFHAVFFI